MEELRATLETLQTRLQSLLERLDLAGKKATIAELEAESGNPTLWDDPPRATALMQRLTALKEKTERWDVMQKQVAELHEWLGMLTPEEPELVEEVSRQARE